DGARRGGAGNRLVGRLELDEHLGRTLAIARLAAQRSPSGSGSMVLPGPIQCSKPSGLVSCFHTSAGGRSSSRLTVGPSAIGCDMPTA
ncbi:MAG: hypothetical protein OEZ14_14980, partial [Acidimicrobiia bacterium]|nr:hypothetical protein [Acidimicrobiia bacterium]